MCECKPIQWEAEIEKFRYPDKAYAKPLGARAKSRWHTIYQNKRGRYIMLRGNRVYESEWRFSNVGR